MLLLWPDQLYRPTRDVDLEGIGDTDPERLREVFQAICRQPCPEDALRFDEASVQAQEIRVGQAYGGVRVTFSAFLGKAKIRLQVDVGFGDAITPDPRTRDFPTLLPLPAPRLRMYPIETVVAEKLEAIARLGRGNSRMKDFRDLATFARRSAFEGQLLCRAVKATFERRQADLEDLDEILDLTFFDDPALDKRWRAYCRTTDVGDGAATFTEIGAELIRFVQPLRDTLHGREAPRSWQPETGWSRG